MSDCLTCEEVKKNEKQLQLEKTRGHSEEKGRALAESAGRTGFYIAAALNGTGWLIELDRREDSKLKWERISIL